MDYADKMPIDEFIEDVKIGGVIDDDGIGYAGYESEEDEDMQVTCNVRYLMKLKQLGYTHVYWYNK